MHPDPDDSKGAVEQDRRQQPSNTSLSGQLPHRTSNPLVKNSDSDFPEPGNNEEHTGEPTEAQLNDQQPGHRQKQNQKKDDGIAA